MSKVRSAQRKSSAPDEPAELVWQPAPGRNQNQRYGRPRGVRGNAANRDEQGRLYSAYMSRASELARTGEQVRVALEARAEQDKAKITACFSGARSRIRTRTNSETELLLARIRFARQDLRARENGARGELDSLSDSLACDITQHADALAATASRYGQEAGHRAVDTGTAYNDRAKAHAADISQKYEASPRADRIAYKVDEMTMAGLQEFKDVVEQAMISCVQDGLDLGDALTSQGVALVQQFDVSAEISPIKDVVAASGESIDALSAQVGQLPILRARALAKLAQEEKRAHATYQAGHQHAIAACADDRDVRQVVLERVYGASASQLDIAAAVFADAGLGEDESRNAYAEISTTGGHGGVPASFNDIARLYILPNREACQEAQAAIETLALALCRTATDLERQSFTQIDKAAGEIDRSLTRLAAASQLEINDKLTGSKNRWLQYRTAAQSGLDTLYCDGISRIDGTLVALQDAVTEHESSLYEEVETCARQTAEESGIWRALRGGWAFVRDFLLVVAYGLVGLVGIVVAAFVIVLCIAVIISAAFAIASALAAAGGFLASLAALAAGFQAVFIGVLGYLALGLLGVVGQVFSWWVVAGLFSLVGLSFALSTLQAALDGISDPSLSVEDKVGAFGRATGEGLFAVAPWMVFKPLRNIPGLDKAGKRIANITRGAYNHADFMRGYEAMEGLRSRLHGLIAKLVPASHRIDNALPARIPREKPQVTTDAPRPIADRIQQASGGDGKGFQTSSRVEEKSTNSAGVAAVFKQFLRDIAESTKGMKFSLRDKPPTPDDRLVTSTIYPFARGIQDDLSARLRIREYGIRGADDTAAPFKSTTGDYVKVEVKAKTNRVGQVEKPGLLTPKFLLRSMFGGAKTWRASREAVATSLREYNASQPQAVIDEVVRTIDEFYARHPDSQPVGAVNVEYMREGYKLEVPDPHGKNPQTVQITFDQHIVMRTGVDPTQPPVAAGQVPLQADDLVYPTATHPSRGMTPFVFSWLDDTVHGRPNHMPQQFANSADPGLITVVEIKTSTWLNDLFINDPAGARARFPELARVLDHYYGTLQGAQVPGFRPNSGKAAQMVKNGDAVAAN